MVKKFDCPVLYHDKTIETENLCASKIPIAVVIDLPGFVMFPFSLQQAPQPLDIDAAETFAREYQTAGTAQGDWVMLDAWQIQMVAEFARSVQGTLLQLEDMACKIDWGSYYLSRRSNSKLHYLQTVGIPCGQTCTISPLAVDRVRLTINDFDKWLKS